MPRRARYQNGEAGSVLVEFALASALFLTMLFGIVELGRCLYAYHWVSSAARLGVRYAMVRGACALDDGMPCPNCTGNSLPCQANTDNIKNYIQNYANGLDWSQVTVTPTCYVTGSVPSAPPCGASEWIQVEVQYNFSFITPLISNLVPGGGWTMTGTSERIVVQNN